MHIFLYAASTQARNYILDQTNVYATARKRKLRNFQAFKKIVAVMQPDDDELRRREYKRTYEDGKYTCTYVYGKYMCTSDHSRRSWLSCSQMMMNCGGGSTSALMKTVSTCALMFIEVHEHLREKKEDHGGDAVR